MSATLPIWYLISHDAAVLAIVPIERIKEGDVSSPDMQMPAIVITRVSSLPNNTIAMLEPYALNREHVQVTVLNKATVAAPAGPGKKGCDALIALVRKACANQRGNIAGVAVSSILPDVVGPDLADAATGLYTGSIDFIVYWHNAG